MWPAPTSYYGERMPDTHTVHAAPAPGTSSAGPRAGQRPFRVKLRGSVLVIICLPNRRQVRGKLHQLSTSGGVLHLESSLDEKIAVDLVFHLGSATIRERAQTLFPMWATQGWLQPFRFTGLSENSRTALEINLQSFLDRTEGG
jgi:hypothetical protein